MLISRETNLQREIETFLTIFLIKSYKPNGILKINYLNYLTITNIS